MDGDAGTGWPCDVVGYGGVEVLAASARRPGTTIADRRLRCITPAWGNRNGCFFFGWWLDKFGIQLLFETHRFYKGAKRIRPQNETKGSLTKV